jgi:fatty-acid desaturase
MIRRTTAIAAIAPPERPWEAPWWRPVAGQEIIFFYLVLVHLLAAIGLIFFPVPGMRVFLTTLGLACLGGLGTTIAYHRSLAHRSVRLHPAGEQFLIFWAVFNGSGSPRQWVANHRLHHAKSDTPEDVSSPRYGGFWWAHLRWLYQFPDASQARWCPDMNQARYNGWTRLQVPTVALSVLGGAVFGWPGLFWIGAIRLVYSLHLQCLVNSLTHLGAVGEEGADSSRNVWWLGPFQLAAWGENWHRNHHAQAGSARFARSLWQIDIGWYVIRLLETLGLAHDVKRDRAIAAIRETRT